MTTTVVCIETDVDSTTRLEINDSKINSQITITSDDVDTRWPFRAGYPRLLRPSVINTPIKDADKPISDANFVDLKSQIDTILETYNIRRGKRPHKLVYRKQKFGEWGLPRVVVDCTYDKETSHSETWAKAVIKIYTAIQSVAERNIEVGVELLDWQYMSRMHICTCPPDESKELLANWEVGHKYAEKILQLFEGSDQMFQAMTPVGRCSKGQRAYEWSIVIFFDAINAEDDKWDSIENSMRSILPNFVGIEIQQRAGSLFCNNDDGNAQQSVEFDQPSWVSTLIGKYKQEPLPGCEIGPQNKPWQGTMGGYVITEDEETGAKTTYGVTNAHVVVDGSDVTMSQVPAESGVKMQYPSFGTQVRDVTRLFNRISVLDKELQALRSVKNKEGQEDASVRQHTRKAIGIKNKELKWYYNHFNFVKEKRDIGVVRNARLGQAEYYNTVPLGGSVLQTIDLALITMDCPEPWERPLMANANEPMIPKNASYHSWEGDYLGCSNDSEQCIKVVAKLGKGFYRMGIVSEFLAHLKLPGGIKQSSPSYTRSVLRPPQFQMVQDTGVEVNNLDQQEKAIIDAWERQPEDHDSDMGSWNSETSPPIFCEPGDSGSFVMAATDFKYGGFTNRVAMPSTDELTYANVAAPMPFIVGLLWGHSQNANISWMIPFDTVKQEIEQLTGEIMVWPQKRTKYLEELAEFPLGEEMDESDFTDS